MFTSLWAKSHHRVAAVAALTFSHILVPSESQAEPVQRKSKENNDDSSMFEEQCLKRQMFQPKVPYPAWDYNWDGRMTEETSLEGSRRGLNRLVPGKTRHIILVRHGQYDETYSDDGRRVLTPLGRRQAIQTGKRLREMFQGQPSPGVGNLRNLDAAFRASGPCQINAIRVSDMVRAKETAELIAKELDMKVEAPDPGLNEALPAPMIPIRPDIERAEEEIDNNSERIEQAFQRYFWRDTSDEEQDGDDGEQDEFEIIVCHGNIIRYFFCRALQLPPEAWLRMSAFNCSLTYLMVRPSGSVSCRMLGDIGHLKHDEITFSGYHGFKW